MKIPFLNLTMQYGSIKEEISTVLQEVLDSNVFAGGPFVEEFEKAFASYCRCEHAVGCGSGTEALWLPLLALGLERGDEVLTTPSTFIATAEAISFCGAMPVFVDVNKQTGNMDPERLSQAITKRTRAIIPVHLYGQPADMDPILEIAGKHELFVIEDACQAHAAEYKGRRAGSLGGRAAAFSFYPGKNLGAYGEAGAVVTDDANLATSMRMFRDHGQLRKYHHSIIGWNARMDGIQGAVLGVKLKHLKIWTRARRANAKLYDELLLGVHGVTTPVEADYAKHVYHIYAIQTENRDELMAYLADKGIGCGIHYPVPIHLQEAYRFLGYKKGDFPVAEKFAEQVLSLPMYPELQEDQIRYVAKQIREYFKAGVPVPRPKEL